ncbi:MAG: hypothetical protein H8D45_26950 [Bacteroidetes bacterium]|nr:hypothetical protein [Bacteroidota bacterium]
MNEDKEIQKYVDDTSNILLKTLRSLAEGITGIVASEKRELLVSIGHLFQKMRAGYILSELLNEWDKLKEKGRIKDDYCFTEQHHNCLHELLDFLDKDIPDEIRLSALKKILLVAATEEVSDRNSFLPHQYMKLCRNLTSGEMYLILTSYKLSKSDKWKEEEHHSAASWCKHIVNNSDFKYREMVEIHEDELIRKKLLTGRLHPDSSGIKMTEHFRLTELGYQLCEFIDKYDQIEY